MPQPGTRANIDLVELEKLSTMQATYDEIAAFFGVSARTIIRRMKEKKFAEAVERGRARGRLSLRRAQLKMVEDGNAAMGIFLGKNYLGQADQVSVASNSSQMVVLLPQALSPPDQRLAAGAIDSVVWSETEQGPVNLLESGEKNQTVEGS